MARTKKQNRNIIIGLIILVVVIIIANGGLDFGGFAIANTDPNLCSSTVSSISPQIEHRFSNQLQKDAIIVTYSTVPNAECLNIKLSESQIENNIDNFNAVGDILLDIKLKNLEKSWQINEYPTFQFSRFKEIGKVDVEEQFFCTENDCPVGVIPSGSNYLSSGIILDSSGKNTCACFYERDFGIRGEFASSDDYNWEVDAKIGNSPIVSFSDSNPSGNIGSVVYLQWNGNLLGNDGISRPNREAFLPLSGFQQWRMIPTDSWSILNQDFNNLRNQFNSCDFFGNCNNENTQLNGYINLLNQETTDITYQWSLSEEAVENGGSQIISNRLIAVLDARPIYPQFVLHIDADEVGIFSSIGGKPELSCPNVFNIQSGDTLEKTITITNPGVNQGSYTYNLECNQGFQELTPDPPQIIAGNGGQKSIKGTFSLTVPTPGIIESSCTFTAKEQKSCEAGQCLTTSCTFDYESSYTSDCTDIIGIGNKICEQGNTELWTCLEDGSYNMINCQFGCAEINGVPMCLSDDDDDDGSVVSDCKSCDQFARNLLFGSFAKSQQCTPKTISKPPFFINNTTCIFSIFKLLIIPVVTIFGSLFSFNLFRTSRQFKIKNKRNALIVSLILGGLLGVFAYFTWWIGLIGLGAVLIVRFIL